ncbi:MAG: bifunctional DNA-formamidopyrimidine glycosylase/DNA-(apurinic or apyrimidinic site) lyase [Solirubrobacterales bacterium]|nr:bifunctional DNA-formamidopyrimidine glycosylase/DNA-(apurinic or apyrimidinic site) lyase [Solirubrobacterales bacterium]
MPELPEVETIRRQLEPELLGRRIVATEIHDERWTRPEPTAPVAAGLTGRVIEGVGRRGKYLLLGLDDGSTLTMHLRMTGNLLLADEREPDGQRFGGERLYEASPALAHLRAEMELDDGRRLLFTDPRRFGHAALLAADELAPYLDSRLGVEPLGADLTADYIGHIAQGRTAPLKSFLLDQKGIAGIGNIYADEALHRAELHPLSPAGSMRPEHWEALREGIVEALEAGLANGGASIDDYRDSRGEKGSMQEEFLVHTREGQECPRCGGPISRIVVGGRSTYFCAACQTRLRKRRRPRARAARR